MADQLNIGKLLSANIKHNYLSKKLYLKARHNGKMRDYYRILDPPLGTGAYGEVRRCVYKENMKDKKSSMKQYRAVKILSKAYMEERDILSFQNEVECMYKLQHPSILKMYHYFEDPKRYLLVQDIIEGGELYDLVKKEKKFEVKEAAFILKQLLSAVVYMHENKIVHRDLKPENILLEDANSPILEIKLIDFGTAKSYSEGERLTEKVGTIAYMAPEVLEDTGQSYTDKCDVWSIGVIAYILLCGEMPFKEQNPKELKKRITGFGGDDGDDTKDEIWDASNFKKLDEQTQEFIKKLICYEHNRWTSKEAFESDWIKEVSKILICELKEKKDDKDNTFEFAQKSLQSLKEFRRTRQIDGEDSQPKLKEATLSIIANLLILDKHK